MTLGNFCVCAARAGVRVPRRSGAPTAIGLAGPREWKTWPGGCSSSSDSEQTMRRAEPRKRPSERRWMPFNGSAPFSPQRQATPAALGARREDLEILGTDDGARSIAALAGSAPQLDERVPQRAPVGLRKRRERAIGGTVVLVSLWGGAGIGMTALPQRPQESVAR